MRKENRQKIPTTYVNPLITVKRNKRRKCLLAYTELTPKVLDFQTFCCGAHMKKKIKNLVLIPLRAPLFWVGEIAHALEG